MVRFMSRRSVYFAVIASVGLFSLVSGASRVVAEVAAAPEQTPAAWMSEWRASGKSASVPYLSKLLVVKKSGDQFDIIGDSDEDSAKPRQDSYLTVPSAKHLQLVQSINKVGGKSKCGLSIVNSALCMGADVVIDASGPTWELFSFDAKKSALKSLAKSPAGANDDYTAWLKARLGYDGVVLDQKGEFYLAVVPPTSTEGESQALSLVGSHGKLVLSGGKFPGGGMLFVKARNGNVAILQLLIAKDGATNEVKPGTKLIMESAKSKATPSK